MARTRQNSARPRVPAACWAIAAGIVIGACSGSATQDPNARFAGSTVRIIVGLSAGGGHDMYARVMAPYFAAHLPGHPAVIVENMPGAGGLVAANYIAHQARSDGQTIGLLAAQGALAQLLKDEGARFDVRRFAVLGSPGDDLAVCVMSRASRVTLADWTAGHVRPRLGVTNYGSMAHADALLIAEALHAPIRPVIGYKGTADIRMAIESGELDGACVGADAYLASFLPRSVYAVVVQADENDITELAGIPIASRLVSDPAARDLISVLGLLGKLGRYYVAPPGTPDDVIAALRTAFDETMRDPSFLRAASAAQVRIRPIPAREVEESVDALLELPPAIGQRVTSILTARRRN